jgi:hypothetical protein
MTTDPSDLPEPAHGDPADETDRPTTQDTDVTSAASTEPAEPDDDETSG